LETIRFVPLVGNPHLKAPRLRKNLPLDTLLLNWNKSGRNGRDQTPVLPSSRSLINRRAGKQQMLSVWFRGGTLTGIVSAHQVATMKPALSLSLISAIIILVAPLAPAQITTWPLQAGGNGHYYQAVFAPGITWSAASLTASNLGGYLATLTSSQENAFVFSLVAPNTDLWYYNVHWWGPWLGGVQPPGSPEPAGGWRWITGEPFNYSNWASGQPNNNDNENRLQFGGQLTIASTWNDQYEAHTNYARSFVIEYEFKPQWALAVFFALTNWSLQAGGNGHYYQAVLAPAGITWSNASLTASNRGGYLATLPSSIENAFVFSLVSPDTNLWYYNVHWWGPWLGGIQPSGSPEPAGGWQWITGEPFGYANWASASGQPNNNNGIENRLQFGGQLTIASTWNDQNEAHAGYARSFVIEYEFKPQWAPEVFFAEFVSPYPYQLEREVDRPANLAQVIQAAAQFRARLLAPGTEDFESYATNTRPASLQFAGASAGISGPYYIGGGLTNPRATYMGLYPFSGSNYLNLTSNATITVTFNSPQAAFGFFGSDLETNQLRVALVTTNGEDLQFSIPVTRPQGSGGAFFFGVIAPGSPFTAVRLSNTGSAPDGISIDDIVVADATQVIPLPHIAIHRAPAELSWDTVANAGYQLQFTTNLAGGSWTPLHSGYYPGSGGLLSTNYSMPIGEPQRFYRIAVTNSLP
jgi:hypothetical protein